MLAVGQVVRSVVMGMTGAGWSAVAGTPCHILIPSIVRELPTSLIARPISNTSWQERGGTVPAVPLVDLE